jgi:hypothetical protein
LNDINAVFPGMPLDVLRDSTKSKKYTDSLLNKLQPTFVNESYVTWMPTRMFFGAEYQLTLRDKVGALMQFQFYNKRTFAAYSLSYNRRVGTNWDITSNYSFSAGSYYNLGFGTSVKWGAFQIYMMQDDILWLFLLEKSRNFTFRLGCNLVWGQKPLRKRI